MQRVAIVISSQYGQTVKIAESIRARLALAQMQAEVLQLHDASDVPTTSLVGFDTVIVGGPIYVGKFPAPLLSWVKANVERLNRMPNALFSVSLNAASTKPEAKAVNQQLLDGFAAATGFKPRVTASLVGAVQYRQYGLFKRWMLKRICAAEGGPTDTSRDHELTDWDQVDEFTDRFLAEVLRVRYAPAASLA